MKNINHGLILLLLVFSSCVLQVEDSRQYIYSLFPVITQKHAELINVVEKRSSRLRLINGVIKVHDDINLNNMVTDIGFVDYKKDVLQFPYMSVDEKYSYIKNSFIAQSGRNELPSWFLPLTKATDLCLYFRSKSNEQILICTDKSARLVYFQSCMWH